MVPGQSGGRAPGRASMVPRSSVMASRGRTSVLACTRQLALTNQADSRDNQPWCSRWSKFCVTQVRGPSTRCPCTMYGRCAWVTLRRAFHARAQGPPSFLRPPARCDGCASDDLTLWRPDYNEEIGVTTVFVHPAPVKLIQDHDKVALLGDGERSQVAPVQPRFRFVHLRSGGTLQLPFQSLI